MLLGSPKQDGDMPGLSHPLVSPGGVRRGSGCHMGGSLALLASPRVRSGDKGDTHSQDPRGETPTLPRHRGDRGRWLRATPSPGAGSGLGRDSLGGLRGEEEGTQRGQTLLPPCEGQGQDTDPSPAPHAQDGVSSRQRERGRQKWGADPPRGLWESEGSGTPHTHPCGEKQSEKDLGVPCWGPCQAGQCPLPAAVPSLLPLSRGPQQG